jgi:hypothetical protein
LAGDFSLGNAHLAFEPPSTKSIVPIDPIPERVFLACGPNHFLALDATSSKPQWGIIGTSDLFGFLKVGSAVLIVNKSLIASPSDFRVAGRISGFSEDGDLVGTVTVSTT